MAKAKSPSDVRGAKIRCINYEKCPICYGCRNYNSIDPECAKCATKRKYNICDTIKHKSDIIANFISRPQINLSESVEFKSK